METDTNSFLDILPTEIIIQIFSYLEYVDIKMGRFVCKTFEQILERLFINRSCLKLDYRKNFKLDPTNESCNIVFKTNKPFKHITFNEYEFDATPNPHITEFWNLYCDSIVTLRFKCCIFSEEQLLELLPRLKNLKALEFGVPKSVNVNYAAKIIACLISTVEALTFTSPITVSRNVIDKIPEHVVPTITELNLQYIGYEDEDYTLRDSGEFAVLKRLRGSLRTFSCVDDVNFIQCLNEIDLKLESLKFRTTAEISDDNFEKFTKLMCGLKHLSIEAACLTDDHAKMICDNMPELRTLKYIECDILYIEGIKYAANLKHLETFEVSITNENSYLDEAITEGIAKQLNPTMKNLYLDGNFSNDTLIAVSTNLPNLLSLTLETYVYFSAELLSVIFDRQRDLNYLHVSSLNSELERDMFQPYEVENKLTPPPIPHDVDIRCLTKLKSFNIGGHYSEFPGISLDKLAEITELQNIEYRGYNQLSKMNILKVLKSCTKLKKIVFRGCNDFAKSDEDKNEIRNAYPSNGFELKVDCNDF